MAMDVLFCMDSGLTGGQGEPDDLRKLDKHIMTYLQETKNTPGHLQYVKHHLISPPLDRAADTETRCQGK